MFHGSAPQRFTFWEAKAYCLSHGAELTTTAQLYAAWNDGLNHCSPGWLADGSVRYPIVTPRERCGGGEPGVRTVYRYSNQTGFPEVHTRHDVYCFKSKRTILCPAMFFEQVVPSLGIRSPPMGHNINLRISRSRVGKKKQTLWLLWLWFLVKYWMVLPHLKIFN